jgi:cytochrome c553
MTRRSVFAASLIALMLGAGFVAATTVRTPEPLLAPATGEPLPVAAAAVTRCAFCHGSDGHSNYEIWPSLAGLDADYLVAQLNAFAKGPQGPRQGAHSVQMHALSKAITPAERAALAAHYAGLPAAPFVPARTASPGRSLHLEGTGKVTGCATCHGEAGEGNAEIGAPRIGGQHARYIESQMRAFASGARTDNGSGMTAIAAAMTDEQITAIAAYLGDNQSGVAP